MKSLGAYRGYGCLYELKKDKDGVQASTEITLYRYGYKFRKVFTHSLFIEEKKIGHYARTIIDALIAHSSDRFYPDLPDTSVPNYLEALPR